MLVNVSMTFHEDILNGFKLQSYRADGIVFCSPHSQSSKGHNQKNIYPTVMVLAHCLMLVNYSI